MSSLFVLLPPAPVTGSSEFPYVVSTDGRSVGVSGRAVASLLPQASGAGSEVVAIVPARALSWHRFDWPRGVPAGSPRLRAVLEGLLEERLLDEPEAVHFAVEPDAGPGAPAWVAACDRAWLRQALQALESAGRPATRIVPELAPETPTALFTLDEGDEGLLAIRSAEGVQLMPLVPPARDLLATLDTGALCLAEPATAAAAEALLQRPMVLQQAVQRWLQAGTSRWDLAQFDLATSGRARTLRKFAATVAELAHAPAWRPARWGAVVLVLAHLAGLNTWAWRERSNLAAQREQVRDTLTRTFPQVKLVIDAPLQMEREVASLRQATGAPSPGDLETLLGALAGAAPGRVAQGIDYSSGELRVRGLGWSEAELRAATPNLRTQGLAARLDGEALVLRVETSR